MKCDSSSKLGYAPALDGLRGVSVLGVMGYHAGVPLLKGGFIGVDIFFVLSGFLITALLIREFDESGSISLKNFYMRRVLRLGPALIFLLIVFCLASYALLSKEEARKNYIDALISLGYFSNWTRAFLMHRPKFLGHTWSLSIEWQFYILWPIILLVLLHTLKNRHHIAFIASAIALLSWLFRIYLCMTDIPPERLYNGLDTRVDTLMIGCVLGVLLYSGLITDNIIRMLQKPFVIITPVSMAGLLAFCALAKWRDPRMFYFGFVLVELMVAALVLDISVNSRSFLRRLLSMRWLVWVGSISYGLYLWHYPVYRAIARLGFDNLILITIASLTTFAVAALSYYAIEIPVLRLKKHFTYSEDINDIQQIDAVLSNGGKCTTLG